MKNQKDYLLGNCFLKLKEVRKKINLYFKLVLETSDIEVISEASFVVFEAKMREKVFRQLDLIEAILQDFSVTKVAGLVDFLITYLEILNRYDQTIELEKDYIFDIYGTDSEDITRPTLLLFLVKFLVMIRYKEISQKIKDLDVIKHSLVLIYELYQYFQTKRLYEVDDLLKQLLSEVFRLNPLKNELKFIIDLGITSFILCSSIWVIDKDRITFKEKYTDGHINPLTYKELALEFEQFHKPVFIIQNQKIIGLNLSFIESPIPKSINLLTKLRFLIINSNILPEEIPNLHTIRHLSINMSKLDSFPQQLAQLSKLRYLHISGYFMKELPDIPKMFPKLRDLKM